MKNTFNARPFQNLTLPETTKNVLRRTATLVEQFPAPSGPAAAMVFVGTAILAACAAALFWVNSQQPAETASARESLPPARLAAGDAAASGPGAVTRDETDSADAQALNDAGGETRQPTGAAQGASLAANRAGESPARPRQPTRSELASVLALPDSGASGTVVAVAETTEELLALEAIQRREVEADLAETSTETTAAIRPDPGPRVAATATTWVNLRAGPSDDAEVLTVVPGDAEIQAEAGCNWCAVTYEGRDGYIYKNFIDYR